MCPKPVCGCLVLLLAIAARAFAAAPLDPSDVAATIDRRLAEEWARSNVAPAEICEDATFLRRASLDLIGRIPTVAELRNFDEDRSADKRSRSIARLVDSASSAQQFATFWRRTWVPQADTPQFARLIEEFEPWLVKRLQANQPYDKLAGEVLTFPAGGRPASAATSSQLGATRAFYEASEYKPELLAANSTRAFLGINLDCAQCHDHPFARWTRDQFWQTAAFFARPSPANDTLPVRLEVSIPNTDRSVGARLLTSAPVAWPNEFDSDTGRKLLADWITSAENPYFARNAVNRLWAHFFGAGLVEPLDDLSGDNAPSHPELLDELAAAFAQSGFDLKFLTRAIVLSRAYQLSSEVAPGQVVAEERRLFNRMPVRGLTGEQLYDSIRVASGLPAERADLDPAGALVVRGRFTAKFRVERPAAAQRSIMQALSLMNGDLTSDVTQPGNSPILSALIDAPFLDPRGRIETLVMAALGRPATQEEITPLLAHLEQAGAGQAGREALGDIFWALVNSSEFNTNR